MTEEDIHPVTEEDIHPVLGEGFVQTSYSKFWHGKYKCVYCTSSGWPQHKLWFNPNHWSLKHGLACRKRPA